jgi:uncharacterized flavoprotein (TIGR03862 family)
MAAEVARDAGLQVDLYESQGSVGRKFLLAGKGGLNLTHSEAGDAMVARYGVRAPEVGVWLRDFNNEAVRAWARQLGVETIVGTSGRVFPADLKAAPLLRGWVRRLRASGVRIHVHHSWCGFEADGTLRFRTPQGERVAAADATVLAMGGASWPQLGSDGAWVATLSRLAVDIAPLQSANCGFDVGWTEVFAQRYAGSPLKSVIATARDAAGRAHSVQSEFVVTAGGIEGGAIYALSATLRDAIARDGFADLLVDLAPARERVAIELALSQSRDGRSLSEHLRRSLGIEGVKTGLLYERVPRADLQNPGLLAAAIKSLPLRLLRARPIAEAISSAGGIRFSALDAALMITVLPGVFCAGEMLDWEAPTGGYLLNACMASGRIAALGAVEWLRRG